MSMWTHITACMSVETGIVEKLGYIRNYAVNIEGE